MTRWRAGLVAVALSLLVAAPVRADDDDTTRGRELFREGVALTRENRWDEALRAFEKSAALRPHARTSHNMAYCERALGRLTRAYKLFDHALAQDRSAGGEALDAEQRRAAESYLEELRKELATADLHVAAGVLVAVDGRPLERLDDGTVLAGTREPGPAEPAARTELVVLLDPGSHVVVVERAGAEPTRATERFARGERRRLRFDAERAEAPRAATERTKAPPAPAAWSAPEYAAVAIGVGGVANLVAGTVFGVRAMSRWDEAQTACPGLTVCPDDRGSQLALDARRDGNVATLTLGLGAAALVSAAILWLTTRGVPSQGRSRAAAPMGGAF